MAINKIRPPITLRSDCISAPTLTLLNAAYKPTTLAVLRQYRLSHVEISKHNENGELALGWALEVAMPHERMSVMLWTLAVLSAIMGLLLILTAQAVPS